MYKIEVIVRVVNQHGDVVDTRGVPAMHPVDHVVKHVYPEAFAKAEDAHKEMKAVAPA